ncbi:MAG: hypothetical protein DRJ52_06225 [Thermoprotei archaeon]|nr:MAG: hypothetical protein DRJ52_06225 [Thermoprotei archaeon]
MRVAKLLLFILVINAIVVKAQPTPEETAEAFLGPFVDLAAFGWIIVLIIGLIGLFILGAKGVGLWKSGRRNRAIDTFFEISEAFAIIPVIYILINVLNTMNASLFPHQKDVAIILNGLLERAWSVAVKLFTKKKAGFILMLLRGKL